MKKLALLLALIPSFLNAHELTPTYPKLNPSYVDGVSVTRMLLFNRREDVSYYEIEVYDEEFNQVVFATSTKLLKVDYLDRVYFDVYIRNVDTDKATYICTKSKLFKGDFSSGVASRICSKLK